MTEQANQPLYKQYGLKNRASDRQRTQKAVEEPTTVGGVLLFYQTPEGHDYWWAFRRKPHTEGIEKLKAILASFPEETKIYGLYTFGETKPYKESTNKQILIDTAREQIQHLDEEPIEYHNKQFNETLIGCRPKLRKGEIRILKHIAPLPAPQPTTEPED